MFSCHVTLMSWKGVYLSNYHLALIVYYTVPYYRGEKVLCCHLADTIDTTMESQPVLSMINLLILYTVESSKTK